MSLEITGEVPESLTLNTPSGKLPVVAKATVTPLAAKGLRGLEAATVQGTAIAEAVITQPNGRSMNVQLDTVIADTPIPASGPLITSATGATPSVIS